MAQQSIGWKSEKGGHYSTPEEAMESDITDLLLDTKLDIDKRREAARVLVSYREMAIEALTLKKDPKLPRIRKTRKDAGTKRAEPAEAK